MNLPIEESEFIYRDVEDILRRIRERNPLAVARFSESLNSSIQLLSRMPGIGRIRRDLGSQEIRSWRVRGFGNYLIFYEIHPDRLRLLRVLHGYPDLQEIFGR